MPWSNPRNEWRRSGSLILETLNSVVLWHLSRLALWWHFNHCWDQKDLKHDRHGCGCIMHYIYSILPSHMPPTASTTRSWVIRINWVLCLLVKGTRAPKVDVFAPRSLRSLPPLQRPKSLFVWPVEGFHRSAFHPGLQEHVFSFLSVFSWYTCCKIPV